MIIIKSKWIWILLAALLASGCAVNTGPHSGGWSYSQKSALLDILERDTYASLCELKPIYEKYLQTKNQNLLNKLLIGYTKNLANSCIDISAFRASQRSKKSKKIKTHYAIHRQSVSSGSIMSQLQSGKSIEEILSPYIPTSPQFARLVSHYHAMRAAGDTPQLRKIKLNIERTKLMKPDTWSTYALINVPEYKIRLFENGAETMEFAVIVGKRAWQTPIFDSMLKYIVLNPAWNVPDNIAREELIPKIVRNPNYLKRRNMVVRKDYNIDSNPVNPKSVNWKKYLSKEYKKKPLPYKIIERSSGKNALGTVKFMFPNRFSVYMHDTQSKSLFARSQRAFSHGCIRLSEPKRLLAHIARNYTSHSMEEIEERANSKKTNYVNLNQHIPVHIVYFTAYVDEGGALHFYNDIYGFDASQKMKGAL